MYSRTFAFRTSKLENVDDLLAALVHGDGDFDPERVPGPTDGAIQGAHVSMELVALDLRGLTADVDRLARGLGDEESLVLPRSLGSPHTTDSLSGQLDCVSEYRICRI